MHTNSVRLYVGMCSLYVGMCSLYMSVCALYVGMCSLPCNMINTMQNTLFPKNALKIVYSCAQQ